MEIIECSMHHHSKSLKGLRAWMVNPYEGLGAESDHLGGGGVIFGRMGYSVCADTYGLVLILMCLC
jgi:hypothetical protein